MTLDEDQQIISLAKKKEAVAKYFGDFFRTIGTAALFFSLVGIVLDRPEVIASASSYVATVAIGVFGFVSVAFGVLLVLIYTQE